MTKIIQQIQEDIVLSVYEENDTPATRTTAITDKGDEIVIVADRDGSTPVVSVNGAISLGMGAVNQLLRDS